MVNFDDRLVHSASFEASCVARLSFTSVSTVVFCLFALMDSLHLVSRASRRFTLSEEREPTHSETKHHLTFNSKMVPHVDYRKVPSLAVTQWGWRGKNR